MRPFPEKRHSRARFSMQALAGLVLLLTLAWPLPAQATRVRDIPLPDMVSSAGPVIAGQVSAVEMVTVNDIPATRVTFTVEETIKGQAEGALTLTFLGGTRPGGLPYRVPGMPAFRPGDELVLLAYPPSAAGLTAPVGLYQGALKVSRRPDGSRQVHLVAAQRRAIAGLRQAGLLGEPAGSPPARPLAPAGADAALSAAAAAGRGQAAPAVVPYEAFLAHLRALAAGSRP